MKVLLPLLIAIGVGLSSAAYAHVNLIQSVPAKEAKLKASPDMLTLTFSKEVRVVKVSLKNKQGEKIKFGFKPVKVAATEFSWPLPTLAPENYSVELIFLGKDGHKMKDTVSFGVD